MEGMTAIAAIELLPSCAARERTHLMLLSARDAAAKREERPGEVGHGVVVRATIDFQSLAAKMGRRMIGPTQP